MKILYILAHFPQNSESYVDAEMLYVLQDPAIQVEVWSPVRGYGDEPKVRVHRGSLQSAILSFLPDVIHIHHLTTASHFADQCPRDRVTIRAHSFDWNKNLVEKMLKHRAVRKIFAFPHLARQVPGVEPMPVAYDPKLYYRDDDKNRRSVVRVCAGLPTKRLQDFVIVGNQLGDDADFTLAMNMANGNESVVDQMSDVNKSLRGKVQIVTNLSRADVATLVRKAAVYMSTYSSTAHPFGMPISMAEAMASGAVVLARSGDPAVSEYMGQARLLYSTLEEAEAIVRAALRFTDEERRLAANDACANAERFRSDVVLPKLVEEWNRICRDHL
jgi:hypothetical protein